MIDKPVSEMTRAEKVIAFIERKLIVPDGVLRGQHFRLIEAQKKFLYDVYDNPAGTRHAIFSTAKKNGKTTLMAGIALAHICGPEAVQNSQLRGGALSREQAGILYRYIRDTANISPEVRDKVRCVDSSKKVVGLRSNVEFIAMSAEAKTAHGGSPLVAFRDEVGQIAGPTDDFFNALETSQGAHANPLLFDISTQAPTDGAMLSLLIDDALAGNDPQTVCHLYAAPEGADLMDEDAWRAANPALGIFRSLEDLRKLAAKAKRIPSEENLFRNFFLNQRVTVFTPFVTRLVWSKNAGPVLPFVGPVYGGLDLSETTDLTSFVLTGRDANGKWAVRPYFWLPGDTLQDKAEKDRVPYDVWHQQGLLFAPSGKAVSYEQVARDISEICAREIKGKARLEGIAYDRHKIEGMKRHMAIEGFSARLVEFGQGMVSMSPAVQTLEIDLLNGDMRHGDHPVLKMCASNAVVKRDEAGNRKLDKAKSSGRIDGMVALVMARGLAEIMEPKSTRRPKVIFV